MSNTSSSAQIVLGHTSYGKSAVRLVKVMRRGAEHDVRDLHVDIALEGDFDAAYIHGNNSQLLATDTMRNTVYALAKEHSVEPIEDFGLVLCQHFLHAGPTVRRVRAHLVEYLWGRIEVGGQPHPHAFTRSAGERTATVVATPGEARVDAGIDNLLLMKTTASGWENFYRDEYTTLPDAHDRILATSLAADWSYSKSPSTSYTQLWRAIRAQILTTFTDHYSRSVQNTLYRMGKAVLGAVPEVERIHFALPNKHHLLFDLARFGLDNDNEIFQVTSEPYGLIEGTVERSGAQLEYNRDA